MDKPPKFLLCENPIADLSDGRLFILHNRRPHLLAEVKHYENLNDSDRMEIEKSLTLYGRLDYPPETIFLAPVWIYESELSDSLDAQQKANKLAGLMRRMADWYEAYLVWEDGQDQ